MKRIIYIFEFSIEGGCRLPTSNHKVLIAKSIRVFIEHVCLKGAQLHVQLKGTSMQFFLKFLKFVFKKLRQSVFLIRSQG